jgi:hypothetical protein
MNALKIAWNIAALIWIVGGFIRMFSGDDFHNWGLCLALALISMLCGEILKGKK